MSHTATSDMETIEQDAPIKASSSYGGLRKSLYDRDDDDDFPFGSAFNSYVLWFIWPYFPVFTSI